MQSFARKANAHFSDGDELGLYPLLEEMKLFRKGFRKRILSIVTIEEEWGKCHVIDYTHRRARGNHTVRKSRTVCFLNSKLLGMPEFQLRPRYLIDRIIGLVHKQGMLFPDHLKFSNKYILKSENESMIRHYFRGEVLDALLKNRHWHAEGVGYYLVLYGKEGLVPERQLSGFVQSCMHLGLLLMKNRYDANWLLK